MPTATPSQKRSLLAETPLRDVVINTYDSTRLIVGDDIQRTLHNQTHLFRTHPAFLARWNTKRKPLHHYHLLPGAQPVTSGGASLGASRTSAHRGT